MQNATSRSAAASALDLALARLHEILMEGLDHGFFDCVVSCEVVNERKRRLVIKAGKSHQFTISEDELRRR